METRTIIIIVSGGLMAGLIATLIGWPFFMFLPLIIPLWFRRDRSCRR